MEPDSLPRQLREKTEKHYCVSCLREVEREEYFANDFLCDACVEKAEGGSQKAEVRSQKAEVRSQTDE